MPTCINFDVYLYPPLASSLRHYKDITNLLVWVLWECLIMGINNDGIVLQETLMPKVLKSTCKKFWSLSACKKQTSSLTTFWDNVAILENLGNAWTFPSKS